MKLDEILDVGALRDCITRFLSESVLRRSLSCDLGKVINLVSWKTVSNLCLLLKIESIDLLEFSFLISRQLEDFCK